MDSELKTFLILKYGSINKMYLKYVRADRDFLTREEKQVIVDHYPKFSMWRLEEARNTCQRNLIRTRY